MFGDSEDRVSNIPSTSVKDDEDDLTEFSTDDELENDDNEGVDDFAPSTSQQQNSSPYQLTYKLVFCLLYVKKRVFFYKFALMLKLVKNIYFLFRCYF